MSFVLVRDRSRLGHKPDYRLGWSSEYVRKSMYACRSVSVACRPAEKRVTGDPIVVKGLYSEYRKLHCITL